MTRPSAARFSTTAPSRPGSGKDYQLTEGEFFPVSLASESGRVAFVPINRGADFFDRFDPDTKTERTRRPTSCRPPVGTIIRSGPCNARCGWISPGWSVRPRTNADQPAVFLSQKWLPADLGHRPEIKRRAPVCHPDICSLVKRTKPTTSVLPWWIWPTAAPATPLSPPIQS